jgi:transposase
LSETRKYRKFTAQQKTEIVLAPLRGPKSVAELCREHEISDSLLRKWRDQFLAAGAGRLQGKSERTELDELRGQVAKLERALGRKTMEVQVAGELLRGLEVSMRVARSRELVAQGRPAAVVARVAGIRRQAIYRRPPRGQRRPLEDLDRVGWRSRAKQSTPPTGRG